VQSGDGGDGSASFRREAHVPRGGPDGGDGGRGGHVYIEADAHLNTLLAFKERSTFAAQRGGNGGTARKHGRNGRDVTVRVPPGTVVRAEIEGVTYEIDLVAPGMRLLTVHGGKGGLGNKHFATSTYQVPRIAELGEPGVRLELDLELKLLADVGLVGFPNAGKSTLISVISAARPKIAHYPFTTLQPNLGVVSVGDFSFVVADIPGLIPGAHRGAGLGFDFLRHVERTRLIVHVVDAAGLEGREPLDDYRQIREELRLYSPELAERPQLVALNKIDLAEAQARLPELSAALDVPPETVFPVSAATREGVDALVQAMAAHLAQFPPAYAERNEALLTWPVPEVDPNVFTIEPEAAGYRVRGKRIERLNSMTNCAKPESIMRVQRVMEASGINAALRSAGAQEGDTVYIEKAASRGLMRSRCGTDNR
jgi:GTP-binding protein